MLFASTSEAHSKIYCLQLEVRHEFYLFACKSDLCDPKDVRAWNIRANSRWPPLCFSSGFSPAFSICSCRWKVQRHSQHEWIWESGLPFVTFPSAFCFPFGVLGFIVEAWQPFWIFFIFIFPHRLCLACLFRPAFIILNVVGHGHVVSVRLAWFRGIFGLGPGRGLLLSRLATLVCVLLAIMPKIWLTSRLLLFIMIHFARFYGCQGLSRDWEPTEGPSDNVVRFVCHPHSLYESLFA